jgi:hypothetical protein
VAALQSAAAAAVEQVEGGAIAPPRLAVTRAAYVRRTLLSRAASIASLLLLDLSKRKLAVSSQPSLGGNSHKRGRGRKVSFKEAERQRQQAEAMEQRQQAAQERAGAGGASELSPAVRRSTSSDNASALEPRSLSLSARTCACCRVSSPFCCSVL